MKFLIILSVFLTLFVGEAFALTKNITALNAVLVTGAGTEFPNLPPAKSCQATGETSAGAGSAIVAIQVSNDGAFWFNAGTITLVLSTTEATDGFAMNATWKYLRANVTTLTGTDAYVTVTCNFEL